MPSPLKKFGTQEPPASPEEFLAASSAALVASAACRPEEAGGFHELSDTASSAAAEVADGVGALEHPPKNAKAASAARATRTKPIRTIFFMSLSPSRKNRKADSNTLTAIEKLIIFKRKILLTQNLASQTKHSCQRTKTRKKLLYIKNSDSQR